MRAILLLLAAASGGLTIGGERFAQSEIVDARGLPDVGGGTIVMVTLTPDAAARLAKAVRVAAGKPVAVAIDGAPMSDPFIIDPAESGAIQLKGPASLQAAAALAKSISGKDPLPDSLEE